MLGLERQKGATRGLQTACASAARWPGPRAAASSARSRSVAKSDSATVARSPDDITKSVDCENPHKIGACLRVRLAPAYREIPEFMLNETYRYLGKRKPQQISGLVFRHKLTRIFFGSEWEISGDFSAGSNPNSRASLGTPLPQGSKRYAINELDGEPAPSRGSTRARLQGDHDVDLQRAGRRHQPLCQGKPGHVATRCGHGGPGGPLHAPEGTIVM